MDDAELTRRFDEIASRLEQLHAARLATSLKIAAIAETHPDKPALLKRLADSTEHAIADSLTRTYPETILDAMQRDLEGLIKHLKDLIASEARATSPGR